MAASLQRLVRNIEHYGAPDWIRTSGPQIRNLMLYPAELRVRRGSCSGAAHGASIGGIN